MRTLCAALTFALVPGPAVPADDLGRRLDEWIRPLVGARDLAGAVLVRHRGQDLVRRAYGDRDAEAGARNRIDTRFAIGSIAKQFTAAAVLRLRDQGLLALDDTLDRHLPGLSPPAAITIRGLLRHRSGLIRDVPRELESDDLGALCARILGEPLLFEPGSRTAYSNAGYVVLACVVEALAGGPFEGYLRRHLFEPLGLDDTAFWDGDRPLAGQARGYDPDGPGTLRRTPADDKRRHLGAGGIVSTVGDLARWAESLAGGEVLSARSTREMLTDLGDGRGLGVGVYRRGGRRVVGHDGVTHGYTAFLEWYPDHDVVLLGRMHGHLGRRASA